MEIPWIAAAFALGLGFYRLGLPPLVGYLAAGFALNVSGVSGAEGKTIDHLAHIGVLLLLFTVGLKLRLRNLVRAEVWGGGLLHMALWSGLMGLLLITSGLDWGALGVLAVALGFSSTVMAAKVLEAKRELGAFHGRVAIGILIIQDLIALVLLTAGGEKPLSPWALGVLALPLLRPVFLKALEWSGHSELVVLFGLLSALVVGGAGFEAVGLSGELGALLVGTLLADHPRTRELADGLWGLKEIFLVGFFLSIGLSGLPGPADALFALGLVALLPLKAGLFFFVLLGFGLRARSAFLTALSLASYSEFALITAAVLLPSWLPALALTVACSFFIAAPLNRVAHGRDGRFEHRQRAFESRRQHPDEQPVSLGMAHVVVMGMGRMGTAAYDFLNARQERPVGLDSDPAVVQHHLQAGRRVLYADAEDPGFWQQVYLEKVRAVLLTMNDAESQLIATRQLRAKGYRGTVIASSRYEDEAEAIANSGADFTYLTYSEAGVGLAEHAWQALYGDGAEWDQRQRHRSTAAEATGD
ncbi:MAG: cation:proton antiporter [Candidatus Competibacterales bacterium]